MYGFMPIPIPTINTLSELNIHEKLEIVGALAMVFFGLFLLSKVMSYIAEKISKMKIK